MAGAPIQCASILKRPFRTQQRPLVVRDAQQCGHDGWTSHNLGAWPSLFSMLNFHTCKPNAERAIATRQRHLVINPKESPPVDDASPYPGVLVPHAQQCCTYVASG